MTRLSLRQQPRMQRSQVMIHGQPVPLPVQRAQPIWQVLLQRKQLEMRRLRMMLKPKLTPKLRVKQPRVMPVQLISQPSKPAPVPIKRVLPQR
ncbi:hypothetical protein PY83_13510, partial [Lacticaseibacillus rhamnosus]